MANDVTFTIGAINNATGAINSIRDSFTEFQAKLQTVRQVVETFNQVIGATVGEFVKYANEVRGLSQLNGTNAEDTSRLLQITEDYKVTVDGLTMATRKLSGEGRSLTVDTLAAMSDEYMALGTNAEKTRFLIENFGRTGTQFAEIMQLGSASIRDQAAALQGGLIMTDASLRKAREYEMALEAWDDSMRGVKVSVGSFLLPALMDVNNFIANKSIPAWESVGVNFVSIMDKIIEKSWDMGESIKRTIGFQEGSKGQELIDWLMGVEQAAGRGRGAVKELSDETGNLSDAIMTAAERTAQYQGLISSTIPTLEEMGVAAYQAQLTMDGSFTSEDAQAVLDYKLKLGLVTAEEYAAADAAIAMQMAMDALRDKNITITTNWINNYIDYQNREGIYNPGNQVQEPGSPYIPQAAGGDWLVTRPTMFLAGEAGPERATFAPQGASRLQGDSPELLSAIRGLGGKLDNLPRAIRDAVQQVV